MPNFQAHPGYLFVVATLLPLASFLLIFLVSGLWCMFRRYRSPALEGAYQLVGGDKPGVIAPLVALGAIALAFVASLTGFILFQAEQHHYHHDREEVEVELKTVESKLKGISRSADEKEIKAAKNEVRAKKAEIEALDKTWQERRASGWSGTLYELVRLFPGETRDSGRGTTLTIGFHIDSLSALMFVMVTFIATLIHVFSMGYMADEKAEMVEDHHVHEHPASDMHHGEHKHFERRGRKIVRTFPRRLDAHAHGLRQRRDGGSGAGAARSGGRARRRAAAERPRILPVRAVVK